MIIKYTAFEAYTLQALIAKVNASIVVGWKPQGGIIHVNEATGTGEGTKYKYIQAMVVEKSELNLAKEVINKDGKVKQIAKTGK